MAPMKVSLWAEIRRLYEVERLSRRAISRRLHCCHKTVNKALAMEQPPSQTAKRRADIRDRFHSQIDALIAKNPAMTAVRVLADISKGDNGYRGGMTVLQDYLRQVYPARKEIAQRELKAWLFDIILSKATPQNVRNELRVENLDRITEIARNGPMAARKRALAVLARSKGLSASLVADCLNTDRDTVSKTYEQIRHSNNPLRLLRKRPRRRNCDDRRRMTNALIEILHHKPTAYGINRSNWTLQSLADAYEQQYGRRISETTVGQRFKEAGYSRKKSRRVLTSPDPEYREKVELVLATLHSLKADEMFFFIDELGPLQVKRYGGRCYTPKKKTPTHPQNQRSKGSIIFHAALSATTNQLT